MIWHHCGSWSARALGCCLGLALLAPQWAWPQTAPDRQLLPINPESAKNPGAQIGGEATAEGSAIRDVGQTYDNIFRDLGSSGMRLPVKVGDNQSKLEATFPLSYQFRIPLARWGVRPEEAELKLGRFYLDIRSVSASVLWSDNVNQVETPRKSGTISVVRMELAAIWQVNDALQLAIAGNIIYLPFKNAIGFADPLGFAGLGYGLTPLGLSQLSYEIKLKEWQVVFYDEFRVLYKSFYNNDTFQTVKENGGQPEEDVAGRYVFRLDSSTDSSNHTRTKNTDQVFINRLGANASRLLPTVTRLTAGVFHENYWYKRRTTTSATSRDEGRLALVNERENTRFKPYMIYRASKEDTSKEVDHEGRLGVVGPITEQLDFLGDFGYAKAGDAGAERFVWTGRLTHNPRPGTQQAIEYNRTLTAPDEFLSEVLSYHLSQVIGPYILTQWLLERRTYEDLNNRGQGSQEFRAGSHVVWSVGPRLEITTGIIYTKRTFESPTNPNHTLLTGRLEFRHKTTEKMSTSLLYQYEQRDSLRAGDSYFENLVVLTLTRRF
jgi:hypothetical protein